MSTNPTVGAIGGALSGGLLGMGLNSAFPGLSSSMGSYTAPLLGALGGGLLGGFA
jgi:hypothetical protein